MRRLRGSVLVEVLVMSVLLMVLATGVMQLAFMNHSVVVKVQRDNRYQAAIDACMSQMNAQWASGGACAPGTCSVDNYTVQITCPGNGKAQFTVNDPTW